MLTLGDGPRCCLLGALIKRAYGRPVAISKKGDLSGVIDRLRGKAALHNSTQTAALELSAG